MIRILLGMIIGAAIGAGVTYRLVDRAPVAVPAPWPTTASDAVPGPAPMPPASGELGVPVVVSGSATASAVQPGGFDVPLDASVDAAVARAAGLPTEVDRMVAFQLITAHWSTRTPETMLGAADQLTRATDRERYLAAAAQALAQSSPEVLIAQIGRLGSPSDQQIALGALLGLARTFENPQRLLALSDELPASIAVPLQQTTMQNWAERDPQAALAYAEAMPLGQPRERALTSAAMSFARQDPAAALAWLETQNARVPMLESAVFNGIAQSDPLKAAELLLSDRRLDAGDPMSMQILLPVLMRIGQGVGAEGPALADRLLNAPGAASEQLLPMFLQSWAQADPRAALNWVSAQGPNVGAQAYAQVAGVLANRDVTLAAEFTPRVPAAARGPWLAAVGQAYARQDPDAAIAWLEQYGGQQGYADALLATAQSIAMFDPVRGAELFARVDTSSMEAAGTAGAIAFTWSRSDPAAARSWAMGLPRGPHRDSALAVLVGNAAEPVLDEELLGLMSSDEARTQATLTGIMRIAAGDAARARALLEIYVPDPALRARYEESLTNYVGAAFGVRIGAPAGAVVGPSGQVLGSSTFMISGSGIAGPGPAEQRPTDH